MVAQGFPHIPVPIGTKAITPAIPDAQYKPGTGGEQHGDQVKLSCLWKYPSYDIKKREDRMKDKEKNIEKRIPHVVNSGSDAAKVNPFVLGRDVLLGFRIEKLVVSLFEVFQLSEFVIPKTVSLRQSGKRKKQLRNLKTKQRYEIPH
jgi:hypothetical protein